jgi:hypothetical protein
MSRDANEPADAAGEEGKSVVVLDWCGPFAAKVLSRIHEYDDNRPKPFNLNTVVPMKGRVQRRRA